jgi:TRAP transporter TAXI family solute receptor
LRCLFSIHEEAATLVAAVDAGIASVTDLRGKRVSTGNPGSSRHRIVTDILAAAGLNPDTDLSRRRVQAADAPMQLRDSHIDAFFFTVGHPSDVVRTALSGERDAQVVPISGPAIEKLIAEHAAYTAARVPVAGLYPEAVQAGDVATLGVKATLCTASRVPETIVYVLTRAVFENLERLRRQHPAFAGLKRTDMLDGLAAPMHPGTLRYFREVGLVE